MRNYLTARRRSVPKTLFTLAACISSVALVGCGGSSESAYVPPITAKPGQLPDRLALVEVAKDANPTSENRSICQLYNLLVSGSGPAGYANFDLTDPAAVQREFEAEASLMDQVAKLESPVKAEIGVYADTIDAQIVTLKANGWNMFDPKVLGAYQDPTWNAAVGRIQIWGAAECGVTSAESGLVQKLTAVMLSGGAKPPAAKPAA
jgi:hypothetical protein